MLVEKKIGRLEDFQDVNVEYIDIEWHECHKRILKKELKDGTILGIRLSIDEAHHGIRKGDVFCKVEDTIYVANITKTQALVIDCESYKMVPKVCFEIGNRHAPFFKGDKEFEFYTPYEMPIKVMLEKLGVHVYVDDVILSIDNAISATVSSHSHNHDDGGYDGKNGKPDNHFYDKNYHHHGDGVYHTHDHSHDGDK